MFKLDQWRANKFHSFARKHKIFSLSLRAASLTLAHTCMDSRSTPRRVFFSPRARDHWQWLICFCPFSAWKIYLLLLLCMHLDEWMDFTMHRRGKRFCCEWETKSKNWPSTRVPRVRCVRFLFPFHLEYVKFVWTHSVKITHKARRCAAMHVRLEEIRFSLFYSLLFLMHSAKSATSSWLIWKSCNCKVARAENSCNVNNHIFSGIGSHSIFLAK